MLLSAEPLNFTEYAVERNVLLCSISRYEEFIRVCAELYCMREYTVLTNNCVSHNTIYIKDCEGVLHTYTIMED